MDQVKQYLKVMNKHRFWIGCVLSLCIGLACWFKATGDLQAAQKKDAEIIKQNFTTLASVKAGLLPNETWFQEKSKAIKRVVSEVERQWKQRYDTQQKFVTIWPTSLSEDFRREIVATPLEAEISPNLLEEYRDKYVRDSVKRLCKILDCRWVLDPAAAGDEGPALSGPKAGTAKPMVKDNFKMVWDDASQSDLQKQVDWPNRPMTKRVRMMQEDIWVYEALCRVIAATNKDARGSWEARIPTLRTMTVGINAAESNPLGRGKNRIARLDPTKKEGAVAGTDPKAGMLPPPAGEAGAAAADPNAPITIPPPYDWDGTNSTRGPRGLAPTGGEAPAAERAPEDYRYVSDKARPLTLKEQKESNLTEFRLIPFCVRMDIDQRYLDVLFNNVHSSPLPLEVQQVRINSPDDGKGGGSSSRGGSAVMMESGRMNLNRGTATLSDDATDIISLELRGAAYFFNEPKKFDVPTDPAAATPEAAASPAPDAAAVPPVAAPPVADQTAPAGAPAPTAGAPPAAAPPAGTPPVAQ